MTAAVYAQNTATAAPTTNENYRITADQEIITTTVEGYVTTAVEQLITQRGIDQELIGVLVNIGRSIDVITVDVIMTKAHPNIDVFTITGAQKLMKQAAATDNINTVTEVLDEIGILAAQTACAQLR